VIAFADASARFLTEGIDIAVYRAMGTKAGGESLGGD
jgi:hypothetical protein